MARAYEDVLGQSSAAADEANQNHYDIDSDIESEESGSEPWALGTLRNLPGNAGVIQYLLAESAALDSLASFSHRTKQSTRGLNLCLYHEGRSAVIKGNSILVKCCAELAFVRRSWLDVIASLVEGGAELDTSHTLEKARAKTLLYLCRQDPLVLRAEARVLGRPFAHTCLATLSLLRRNSACTAYC